MEIDGKEVKLEGMDVSHISKDGLEYCDPVPLIQEGYNRPKSVRERIEKMVVKREERSVKL